MTDEEKRVFALNYLKDKNLPANKQFEKAEEIVKYINTGVSAPQVDEDTKGDDQLLTE